MSNTFQSPANIREVEKKVRPATFVNFHDIAPHATTSEGSRTWYARSEYILVAYTEAPVGTILSRVNQADEYSVLLPDADMSAVFAAARGAATVPGRSVVIVPPGESEIRLGMNGRVIRIFTVASAPELAAKAFNAENYKTPDNYVVPYRQWPSPPSGYRVRQYLLDSYALDLPGFEWTRVFRSTTLTVNCVLPIQGCYIMSSPTPRKMGIHRHADIDQIVLFLEGSFRVHARVPWTQRISDWHDDEHWLSTSPSFLAVPPQVVHAVEGIGDGINWVVDMFAPPRADYIALNADEYPMP